MSFRCVAISAASLAFGFSVPGAGLALELRGSLKAVSTLAGDGSSPDSPSCGAALPSTTGLRGAIVDFGLDCAELRDGRGGGIDVRIGLAAERRREGSTTTGARIAYSKGPLRVSAVGGFDLAAPHSASPDALAAIPGLSVVPMDGSGQDRTLAAGWTVGIGAAMQVGNGWTAALQVEAQTAPIGLFGAVGSFACTDAAGYSSCSLRSGILPRTRPLVSLSRKIVSVGLLRTF